MIDTAVFPLPNPENYKKMITLKESRFPRIDSLMEYDKKFKKLFFRLYRQAMAGDFVTDNDFEEYVGRYVSKEQELIFKRSRTILVGCLSDNGSHAHDFDIAKLAAETVEWDVFLRSHLNIMDDRFRRGSDTSYGQGRQKAYVRELEVIDINVSDLLLGISLDIESSSQNHYFARVNKMGRSLSEAGDKNEIGAEILAMITDASLDDYNRLQMYYLFLDYNTYTVDAVLKAANAKKLDIAVATLPVYIASEISE